MPPVESRLLLFASIFYLDRRCCRLVCSFSWQFSFFWSPCCFLLELPIVCASIERAVRDETVAGATIIDETLEALCGPNALARVAHV